jgi:hypothetical protein
MANYYSVGYTRYNAQKKVQPGNWKPDVCVDTFEAAGELSGSTIYMFTPPKGSKFKGGFLASDNLGNAATLAVGIVGTTEKFLAATVHGSAATQTSLLTVANIDVYGYEFDGETPVILTTGVGAITGTIVLVMDFYGTRL